MGFTRVKGFNLVELAIGLAIIALVVGSIMMPLANQIESRKIDETQGLLTQARDLLLGFVAANGYLPCPTDTTSTSAFESVGATGHDSVNGACAASVGTTAGYYGYLPAATLGFSPVDSSGFALDGFGTSANRIRYAVYTDSGTMGLSLVRSGGMANLGIPTLGSLTLFNICQSGTGVTSTACGSAPGQLVLATNVAVVIWSVGNQTGMRSVHETVNQSNTRVFVSRTRSDVSGSEFDDQVLWLPMNLLISRMIVAGQLP